jgi:hypothetical protein
MAREAGLRSAVILHLYGGKEGALCDSEIEELAQIERFFQMARAAEREACAKVCEELFQVTPPYTTYAEAAQDCADAIRARGQS